MQNDQTYTMSPRTKTSVTGLGWAIIAILCATAPSVAAEHYVIALPQSQFQFQAYSLFVKPQGTFHTFSGEIVANADNLRMSHVRFVIDATSLDTGNAKRDEHLRSEMFLFVDKYPTITFMSTAIDKEGERYMVQGDLQIRGVTKRLTIPVTVEQQKMRIVVRGNVRLQRRDFGVNYNAFFNPVQNEVDVKFTIVGAKP